MNRSSLPGASYASRYHNGPCGVLLASSQPYILIGAILLSGCAATYEVAPSNHASTLASIEEKRASVTVDWQDVGPPPARYLVKGLIASPAADSFVVVTTTKSHTVLFRMQPTVSYSSHSMGLIDGAAVGGAVFGIIGVVHGVSICNAGVFGDPVGDYVECGLIGAAVLGLPGAVVGAIIGGISGRKNRYRFIGLDVGL